MICISLGELSLQRCLRLLRKVEFAEIRLDRMALQEEDVRKIFSSHPRLIATCRPGPFSEEKRKRLLLEAVNSGAAYVDIEIDSAEPFREAISKRARQKGCRLIVSFHDYSRTPARQELRALVRRCFSLGADLAKISCFIRSPRDNARLLSLLAGRQPVIVTGMGPLGRITRLAAPLCGSPFTYASLEKGKETASGQIPLPALETIWRYFRSE
jgi:3-dehydroquinate dehydratase-1